MSTQECQRYRTLATEVYKAVNGKTPNYIQELFEVKEIKKPRVFSVTLPTLLLSHTLNFSRSYLKGKMSYLTFCTSFFSSCKVTILIHKKN